MLHEIGHDLITHTFVCSNMSFKSSLQYRPICSRPISSATSAFDTSEHTSSLDGTKLILLYLVVVQWLDNVLQYK